MMQGKVLAGRRTKDNIMLCDKVNVAERVINAFFYCMGSILVITLSNKYLKRRRTRPDNDNNTHFHCMVLTLFLLILMAYIVWAVAAVFTCVDVYIWWILKSSGSILYILQYAVIILLLFSRLCNVFARTTFAVSLSTKRAFYCAYCMFNVMALLTFLSVFDLYLDTWGPIISTTAFAILILLIASVVGIFVHKLVVLSSHHMNEHNQELIAVATRTFILTSTCIISSILAAICIGIGKIMGSTIHYEFVLALFGALDLATNFLSVLFGFQTFEDSYMKICGFCQRKGIKCFAGMAQKRNMIAIDSC
eukprot:570296_1